MSNFETEGIKNTFNAHSSYEYLEWYADAESQMVSLVRNNDMSELMVNGFSRLQLAKKTRA